MKEIDELKAYMALLDAGKLPNTKTLWTLNVQVLEALSKKKCGCKKTTVHSKVDRSVQ